MLSDEMVKKQKLIKQALKKESNKKHYAQRKDNKMTCEICAIEVDKYFYEKHCESKRHMKIAGMKI